MSWWEEERRGDLVGKSEMGQAALSTLLSGTERVVVLEAFSNAALALAVAPLEAMELERERSLERKREREVCCFGDVSFLVF